MLTEDRVWEYRVFVIDLHPSTDGVDHSFDVGALKKTNLSVLLDSFVADANYRVDRKIRDAYILQCDLAELCD